MNNFNSTKNINDTFNTKKETLMIKQTAKNIDNFSGY